MSVTTVVEAGLEDCIGTITVDTLAAGVVVVVTGSVCSVCSVCSTSEYMSRVLTVTPSLYPPTILNI